MTDGIHDFTVADCQKNPSEELIVSWVTGALSDISEETFLKRCASCLFLSVSKS